MNKINSSISGSDYRNEFENTGSAFVRNFLTPEYADELAKFFSTDMPSDWWSASTYPDKHGNIANVRNFVESAGQIEENRLDANKVFYNQSRGGISGNISYHFYRTLGNHVEGCYCAECKFREWLLSSELLGFLESVSGEKYDRFNTTFASKYSEGCFLSPHTDHANGDIGFVLQLTKNWKPQWGGLLHFMDDYGQIIEKTEVPTFNTLTLFKLHEQNGKWHYVSHVNPGVKADRLAYSGWFQKQ